MFIKGSRYRNLPESSPVNAQEERLRGKELRFIRRLSGRFLHTVNEVDRLDLLSFKYYGDTTRWWQIADANPEFAFPTDLLDRGPVVEETFVLAHAGFAGRYSDLLVDLQAFGDVKKSELYFFTNTQEFTEKRPRPEHFLETTVIVIYPAGVVSRHQQVVARINQELRFLRSFAWSQDFTPGTPQTAEAFTFEDHTAKGRWQAVVAALGDAPGMIDLQPVITEATLRAVYHRQTLKRETIVGTIENEGFAVTETAVAVSRIGGSLVVPPNQVV
jgi:phage tail protein X